MHGHPILLRRFQDRDGQARGLLLNARTHEPSVVGSLYEASLSRRCASPNTLYHALSAAQALLSWAHDARVDLEQTLLKGTPLDLSEIEAFARWLEARLRKEERTLSRESITTYNARLAGAERMVAWFVDQYHNIPHETLPRGALLDALHRTARRAWKDQRKKNTADTAAPDITDDDISAIETFLRGAATTSTPEPRWVRAYLIWRLAIEFGMRIGEILAMRAKPEKGGGVCPAC